MSVIGPRPQLVRDMVFMTDEQRLRHTAKPGLSGLAQVNGRNAISWEDKLEWDLKYIRNISLAEDIKIILATVKKAFIKQEGITQDDMATAEDFGDYLLRNGKIDEKAYGQKQEQAKKILSGEDEIRRELGLVSIIMPSYNTAAYIKESIQSVLNQTSMPVNKNVLVIAISQSGETADTLAALRLAKEKGMTTLAIVNVVGSSIAREADKVFYTLAGPEISVATTKAYSAQLAAMYCIAVEFAFVRGKITEEQYAYYISELLTIAPKINKILEDKERLQWFAAKYAGAHDVFFVGRGIDYAVSLEGSLKLKEISYIHSEAYAAGELKHGTISLIEPGTLVIGVLTQSKLYEKTMSNMVECRSRGAYLLGLTTYGKYEIEETVDFAVYVPRIDEYFAGSLAVVPLQLLGYYVSVAKGLDVDKPRNLAKSVTVE